MKPSDDASVGRSGQMSKLSTREEFHSAVKDALRHYAQSDLLAGSELFRTQVVQQRWSGAATIQDIRAMLAETAKRLFDNPRDRKVYRVLSLTYFDPAPKQEAAADSLGMSFSTFRRYLGTGIGRLAEFLWRIEQEIFLQGSPAQQPVEVASVVDDNRQRDVARPLSLLVLPFLDLSPDGELGYLVDGIAVNLMTDLSRGLPGSFIISRSTAFTYKDRHVPVRQIGKELRVRYILEGSVGADARRVRVNVQLIDAHTDEHLWAERFDNDRIDLLQMQEDILARLSRNVAKEMVRHEFQRSRFANDEDEGMTNFEMRCGTLAINVGKQEDAIQVATLFRRALALDRENVDTIADTACTCKLQILNQNHAEHRNKLLGEAEDLISRGLALLELWQTAVQNAGSDSVATLGSGPIDDLTRLDGP
jgi:TolB-like protein